jgi:L-asparaginase/Glu-tRNA(Gln) amidotransferase subunit D
MTDLSKLAEYRREKQESTVLILNTGGTIGMIETATGLGTKPGLLAELMARERSFHDPAQPLHTTPVTRLGARVHYDIIEYTPLIDSSNMTAAHWQRIANDLKAHYDSYDAFVILHGTDTMCFTASALSFMCMYLGKTAEVQLCTVSPVAC